MQGSGLFHRPFTSRPHSLSPVFPRFGTSDDFADACLCTKLLTERAHRDWCQVVFTRAACF